MVGNAGKGRPKGAINRRTAEMMALAEAGETPAAFGLRVMQDETQPLELRLNAARLIAPYVHPRPAPIGEIVTITLPDVVTPAAVTEASAKVMAAVAGGEISVAAGRDLMAILECHRKCLELTVLEGRIQALEQAAAASS